MRVLRKSTQHFVRIVSVRPSDAYAAKKECSKRLIDAGTFWTARMSTDVSNAGLAGDDAAAGPVEIAIEAEVEGDLDVLGRIWNR